MRQRPPLADQGGHAGPVAVPVECQEGQGGVEGFGRGGRERTPAAFGRSAPAEQVEGLLPTFAPHGRVVVSPRQQDGRGVEDAQNRPAAEPGVRAIDPGGEPNGIGGPEGLPRDPGGQRSAVSRGGADPILLVDSFHEPSSAWSSARRFAARVRASRSRTRPASMAAARAEANWTRASALSLNAPSPPFRSHPSGRASQRSVSAVTSALTGRPGVGRLRKGPGRHRRCCGTRSSDSRATSAGPRGPGRRGPSPRATRRPRPPRNMPRRSPASARPRRVEAWSGPPQSWSRVERIRASTSLTFSTAIRPSRVTFLRPFGPKVVNSRKIRSPEPSPRWFLVIEPSSCGR